MAEPETVDSCQKCYFYRTAGRASAARNAYGTCRVRSPLAGGGWPVVNADDWCGEFSAEKPKEGGLLRVLWAIHDKLERYLEALI